MKNARKVEELIAYGMPAYKMIKKPLVYFTTFKNHIGFYVTLSGNSEFKDEFSKCKLEKGSVQFPLHKPFPKQLIIKMVKYRVELLKK